MATWPSSNKPVTTTTDADSDSISGARADINKAITNQIEIIDMFNIPGSPTDNYILKYNASTSVFDMEADAGGTISSVTNFVDNRVVTASGATTLNGEANLTFDGSELAVTGAISASSTCLFNGINNGNERITNVANPTSSNDAATKSWVQNQIYVDGYTNEGNDRLITGTTGGVINGEANLTFVNSNTLTLANSTIAMGTGKITGMGDPAAAQDAATKAYVDANAGVVTGYTNGTDNRILTSSGTTTINGESTLLYDGTSLSNTTAPTFTAASTPIQLNGTQPNVGGYFAHTSINTQTSRGGIGYRSNPSAGGSAKVDTHTLFFDLDDDFGLRPSGSYQGDRNLYIQANHTADRVDLFFDGFSTAGVSAYGHGGNSYAAQALEFNGSSVKLQAGGTNILSIDSDSVDITQDVVITDTEQLKFGTTTTIDKDEISTTGGFTVNVDSDNSSNEAFIIQSAGTDVMRFSRGPGGDAEMNVKGDGFFIKDDQNDVQFSMDMSNATSTGINVFRTNENKSLNFTLKTDDDDDTGNYDGNWAFRQNANEKALILERSDSSTVEIFEVRDSADVATADPVDIFEFKIPPVLPSFTVANLPTTVVAGAQAFCTNDTGGAVNVFYDGSAWRRCTDRAVAST